MTEKLFDEPTQELIKVRHNGDRALWDCLRVLVEGMLRYGFKKRQIHDFVTAVKKVQ
jgi:hypothetical protein